jgi:multimeric flavodoxin WrbA
MKVLAICGSPRKGNSEWMLNQFAEFLTQNGAKVETLLLRKMEVKRCTGCLKCEDRTGSCRLKDIMNDIYPELITADVLVLASPVYFEMISGTLKNFLDRTCPIWTKMKGKSIVGLAVAEEGIGQTIQNMKTYASLCGMNWAGSVTALAKVPGEAEHDPALVKKLKRLADNLTKK